MQTHEDKNLSVDSRIQGEGGREMTAEQCGVLYWDDKNILELQVVIFVQLCECFKNH